MAEPILGPILVGVDGSAPAERAIDWAAREAVLRGLPLRLVHALPRWVCELPETGPDGGDRGVAGAGDRPPPAASPRISTGMSAATGAVTGPPAGPDPPGGDPAAAVPGGRAEVAEIGAWMRREARALLADARERAVRIAAGVRTSTALLPGDPVPALVEAGSAAAMLVLGSHGLGGFRALLLGSVARAVSEHAGCPVVVVREGATTPDRPREVVVGVDSSASSARAVEFAADEARVRGVPVRAVHTWVPMIPIGRAGVTPIGMGPADIEDSARRLVAETVAPVRSRHPDLEIIEDVASGHPVEVLVEASDSADLLVVGSRGHGGLSGLRLGSVSHGVLHHARCPVAVVRPA